MTQTRKRKRVADPLLPPADDTLSRGSTSLSTTMTHQAHVASSHPSRGSIPTSTLFTIFNMDDVPEALQPQALQALMNHQTSSSRHAGQCPSPRYQYQPKPLSAMALTHKRQKQIDGTVYVLSSVTYNTQLTNPTILHPTTYRCFTSLLDVPHLDLPTISAFTAVDNKADTLPQGQMFKTHDVDKFIQAQHKEVQRLQAMGVFKLKKCTYYLLLHASLTPSGATGESGAPLGTS